MCSYCTPKRSLSKKVGLSFVEAGVAAGRPTKPFGPWQDFLELGTGSVFDLATPRPINADLRGGAARRCGCFRLGDQNEAAGAADAARAYSPD